MLTPNVIHYATEPVTFIPPEDGLYIIIGAPMIYLPTIPKSNQFLMFYGTDSTATINSGAYPMIYWNETTQSMETIGTIQTFHYLQATESFLLIWLDSEFAWLWVPT